MRGGSGSPGLPPAAALAAAPPPSRGDRQSERVRRRGGAGSERRGRGLLASWLRSAHPLRAPPSSSHPLPHLPGLLGLGFPGASPWTAGSLPRDSVHPFCSCLWWAARGPRGGVTRRGEPPGGGGSQAPRPAACSRSRPGHRDYLDRPQGPFSQSPKGGDRMVRTVEDWGAGFEGRGETAFGELFPETIQSPARLLRLPKGFLSADFLFLSRRGDHVPRAPKAATHPSTQPRCHPPAAGSGPSPRSLGHWS